MPATPTAPTYPQISIVHRDERRAHAAKPFTVVVRASFRMVTVHRFYRESDADTFRDAAVLGAARTSRSGRRIVLTLECDGTA